MSASKIPRRLTDLKDVDAASLDEGDALLWEGNKLTGEVPGAADHAPVVLEQGSPATEWTFNHNLGYFPAAVMVVDSAGTAVLGEIIQSTDDTLILRFKSPFSGKVYIR